MTMTQSSTIQFKNFLHALSLLLLVSLSINLSAQVQFKLEKLSDGETFQVSMIPMKSWSSPMNITSTAQVTLKVPTNSFEIAELKSLDPSINWEYNSKTIAPDEAPQFDYLSIGLASMGTKQLPYREGEVVPLFTFKNAEACQGSIALMDSNDPFKTPNSRRANVGNSITVFGAKGEAYQKNFVGKAIACDLSVPLKIEKPAPTVLSYPKIYPNPAVDQITVELQWESTTPTGELVVLDFNGREVLRQSVSLTKGQNVLDMNIKNLPSGLFTVELRQQDQSMILNRFVKQK